MISKVGVSSLGCIAIAAVGCTDMLKDVAAKVVGPVVVLDSQETLQDGQFMSYKLDEGRYEIAVSGSGGLAVALPGTTCAASHEQATYNQTCDVIGVGNLTVKNPTLLGLGSPVVYSIKVVKLPK